ncbi:DMT family transporter [Methylobacterium bullatum]|uniref:Threonine/homoserine exporter RhtA n=1 Tax=Methylobacterium bullatum TaxID=570505 RepID=A0AAV4Z7M8_9HYPH|nr:DMT family transporter [Methylobacterium bullatum]MBD8904248.1 EamA family transporter [Methylobacterium bullatum]GJD39565.1 Threonine/homoserine exporter RhtA [Methylobacterium bullatum]
MTGTDTRAVLAGLAPVAALVGSIVCLVIGTSFAKQLFPVIGAEGTSAYRVTLAAVLLLAVWRPWRRTLGRRDAGVVVLYGLVLGGMNLLFYLSLRTIPLGLAIAIEFVGPLLVAVASSRRAVDLVWVALAMLGLCLLLPLDRASSGLDPVGVACALGAALCWALYILVGQRAGHLPGGQAVALGMSVAALVILPFGIAQAGMALLSPSLVVAGLAVAILSSAIPYSLEMVALRGLPRQTFGILLSLEPVCSALAGFLILGERLTPLQGAAIACIMAASVGSTVGAYRAKRENLRQAG